MRADALTAARRVVTATAAGLALLAVVDGGTQIVVLGIISGSIYGLLALGLVLVYKGSRVLNFAQAEIGTLSLYAAYEVTTERQHPYVVGALAAVGLAVLIGGIFERLIVRPMGDAPRLTVTVSTIGLLTAVLALESLRYGPSPRLLDPPLSGDGMEIAGVVVSPTQQLSVVVVLVIAVALGAFLRHTDFGLGVLGAAQDPTAVRLVGVRLSRVAMFTWGVASALSAVAALLIEPTVGVIAPGALGGLFVSALAAALIGGLDSLPGAFVGGLVVGVGEAEIRNVFAGSSIPNVAALAVLVAIVAILLIRPQGLLGRAPA